MVRHLIIFAAAWTALGLVALPAHAQVWTASVESGTEPPSVSEEPQPGTTPRYHRIVRLQSGLVDRSANNSTWRYYRVEAGGIGEGWQALLTAHLEERGDTRDSAIGLNTYFDLPGTGYGNVQYALSPDHHFLPRHAVTLEYFQPFRKTWVGSINYRRRHYDALDVQIVGARLGKYSGNWFTRLSVDYVDPDSTSSGVNATLMLRRYAANPDRDYVQVYGSTGENVEPVVTGTTRRTFDVNTVGLTLRRHLGAGWGLELLLELAETDRLPTRRTVQGGLVRRW